MLAPKMPKGIEEAIGLTMHDFLFSQLDQIIEGDEEGILADHCFSKAMQALYKRGVPEKYTSYYEKMYEMAYDAQRAKQEADQSGR